MFNRFKLFFIIITALIFSSCNKITITKEYIENDYWNNHNNAINIIKMKVINADSLNYYLDSYNLFEHRFLETDSSFTCSYNGLGINNHSFEELFENEKVIEEFKKRGVNIDSLKNFSKTKKRHKLGGKVFFNKDNGWKWLYKSSLYPKQEGLNWSSKVQEKAIIGELENNTWYRFSGLKMNTKFYIYVYVDEIGNTHNFGVNLANF